MNYYKDTNNKPYVFEDNVKAEIIAKVEDIHTTTLTEITQADYEAMIAPTFEDLQISKLSELQTSYTSANQLDIAYMSTTFQADRDSQNMLVSVLSAGNVPDGFFWLDRANNQVVMTYADLQGLSGAILARSQINFIKYQDLKSQVNAAQTVEELELVVW